MIIRVLGSGAGGGCPQWNCNCRNCASVRSGKPGFVARTQSSLAVSANGADWVLLNASPDLRQQIEAAPVFTPGNGALRASPIKAVVLTNGDVDHIAGLINLREAQPFSVYATPRVLDVIKSNSVFGILAAGIVARIPLELGLSVPLAGAGTDLGLTIEAFDVPGKIALYLEDAAAGPGFGTQPGDTIGLKISDAATGESFFYVPGCAEVDPALERRLKGASLIFFDGTLYADDEMIHQGLLDKSGERMGHVSISGPRGSISAFGDLEVGRKIYVHINNSNPVLDANSAERRAVEAAGWEIGYDGMEVRL
ncbi:MAG: pyrroloquinoline quinone biosynthesis protein PqqB [Hyphomicrobium sp.]|uniref:pyrroloquinoline quinone biosynthesis protein PqqB n=1 Tax=Hyphomicrobium sp. TaxID=82 RepID=UPI0013282DCC|nr:pyrroloquinoline quinone biosynthesis protein PqqB [Hyphomicrobium sp.]KAB2942008.1 MAG: pyrroloquinoline quinone biosynthesis protein PqqB [Hyphomicrobium sp.]MBZ0210524.1 pyrroloquinoline quinone biosynthesis protein PqqB [Hyphomicrobium sp.]